MEDTKDILVVPHSNYIETITKLSKDNFDEYFEKSTPVKFVLISEHFVITTFLLIKMYYF